MSWSFNGTGKPAAIKGALDKYGERLSGMSKEEFDAAKPHLAALVDQNTVPNDTGEMLTLNASGHATKTDGVITYSNCSVKIERTYVHLV